MLPYLELSKSLAIRGHRVTYISTPRNIQWLPEIPSHLSPLIQLVSFTLPHVEHLPYNAESTKDLPPKEVHLLKKAHDGLEVPFSEFLESTSSGTGINDAERLCSTVLGSEFICIRSCFPMESKWITLLAELYKKPVVPIGLLLPSINGTLIEKTTIGEVDVIDWLDGHDPKSVLYIALGSEATLTPNQLHELALDQGLNSRVLDEKELGVEITRNEGNGSFQREDVAKVIRLVMVEEAGKVFRRNAEREEEVFADKVSHDKHFDDFVGYLENLKCES
ncbi:hypothetical protein LUZ60_000252 [Juncus effusus]|nr:hypothetical protein LUZ60_000252 [Juncus effusus]